MGLEIRNGKKYYYHCHRQDGRVKKVYYGSGIDAELAAQRFADIKREREEQRDRFKAEKSQLVAAEHQVAQYEQVALDDNQCSSDAPETTMDLSADRTLDSPDQVNARMQELLAARNAGDPSAETALADLIDRFPAIGFDIGDLGKQALETWLNLITGTDLVFRAAVRNKLELMRSQFTATPDDPVDKLLSQRIMITWLQVTYADMRIAQAGDLDRASLEYLSRRQVQSQRQHLAAIKSWMQLKQLASQFSDGTPSTAGTPKDRTLNGDSSKHCFFKRNAMAKSA